MEGHVKNKARVRGTRFPCVRCGVVMSMSVHNACSYMPQSTNGMVDGQLQHGVGHKARYRRGRSAMLG